MALEGNMKSWLYLTISSPFLSASATRIRCSAHFILVWKHPNPADDLCSYKPVTYKQLNHCFVLVPPPHVPSFERRRCDTLQVLFLTHQRRTDKPWEGTFHNKIIFKREPQILPVIVRSIRYLCLFTLGDFFFLPLFSRSLRFNRLQNSADGACLMLHKNRLSTTVPCVSGLRCRHATAEKDKQWCNEEVVFTERD